MAYTDEEIRLMAVNLLKMSTERDRQSRVGASNLSNGCSRCLAFNFLGDDRATPITDRAWMGRVLGTSFHSILEQRANALLDFDGLEGEQLALAHRQAEMLAGLNPDASAERHIFFADLHGYGRVGGTIDLDLGPTADHIVDWKGSTRKRICILADFLAIKAGGTEIYGRKHTWVKLSEKEYDAEMAKMEYKVTGYFGQASLYMRGAGRSRATLVFIARDGTGVFDNPEGARYDDPVAVHDVFVLSFNYDAAYGDVLIARAQAIWDHLASGGKPTDFEAHEHCFACSQQQEIKDVPSVDAVFSTAA